MLLAVTAFFAACSDDDASWNTNADVTVEMGKTEVKVKEGVGLFNVPIVVNGETTAPVRVHVSMSRAATLPRRTSTISSPIPPSSSLTVPAR